jgi:cell division protein FtsA
METVSEDDSFSITSLGSETPRELPREILVKIVEPRMQEILQMVRAEIMKSGYLDMLPAGVVLTGGASQLPGTGDLAERILGMPVRLGLPRDVGGLSDTVQSPVYSTAVGLVMYAAKHQADLHEQEKTATLVQGVKGFFRRVFG